MGSFAEAGASAGRSTRASSASRASNDYDKRLAYEDESAFVKDDEASLRSAEGEFEGDGDGDGDGDGGGDGDSDGNDVASRHESSATGRTG